MRPRATLFASLIVAIAASRAVASDLDQFGFGARPISMGGAFAALATDFTATYYNPGGLGTARTANVAGGFSYAGYDLEFRGADPRFDAETERQRPLSALTIGVSRPLDADASSILNRVGLGLGVFLPTRQIVGVEAQTGPGVPEFVMYGGRRDKLGVLPAVAFRILPLGEIRQTLAIGVGATVLADIQGEFTFNLVTAPDSSISTELDLTYDVAPNVGLFWWPVDWLSFGLTYRGALSLKAEFDVVIDLDADGVSDFPLDLEAVTLYQPQQVQVGIAIDPVEWLTVALDVTWYDWSQFDDPFITIEPIVAQTDPDFDDIFVPRIGFEIEPVRGFALRLGYYYQPSPIPEQDGATTLVDLDKHVFSVGFGYTYFTTKERFWRNESGELVAEEVEVAPITIDAFIQYHHLIEDEVEKEDPATSPVGAGYEASGMIVNGGIQVILRF